MSLHGRLAIDRRSTVRSLPCPMDHQIAPGLWQNRQVRSGPIHPVRQPAVVLVGAGLSTASGIPDYRSDNGIWERFDQDEFHIDRFHADPERFWRRRVEMVRQMGILDARPNEGHHILAEAVRQGHVSHVITQNIDGLHHKAETPADRVIEVHGNSALCRCIGCGATRESRGLVDAYDGSAPRCGCGQVFKPDVVLFGEPVTELHRAAAVAAEAETFIAIGTSLQVWPVAGLVQHAVARGADILIINGTPTPFDSFATVHRGDVIEGLRTVFAQAP